MTLVTAQLVEVLKPFPREKNQTEIDVLSPFISGQELAKRIGLSTPRRLWDYKKLAIIFLPEEYKRLESEDGGITKEANQLTEDDVLVFLKIRYLVNTYYTTKTQILLSNPEVKQMVLDPSIKLDLEGKELEFVHKIKPIAKKVLYGDNN